MPNSANEMTPQEKIIQERVNQYEDKTIDINVSESNQCWDIPAPCITKGNYKNLLK